MAMDSEEALPKFGARLPIRRLHRVFVATDSGEALPKFDTRLSIRRPHRIFPRQWKGRVWMVQANVGH